MSCFGRTLAAQHIVACPRSQVAFRAHGFRPAGQRLVADVARVVGNRAPVGGEGVGRRVDAFRKWRAAVACNTTCILKLHQSHVGLIEGKYGTSAGDVSIGCRLALAIVPGSLSNDLHSVVVQGDHTLHDPRALAVDELASVVALVGDLLAVVVQAASRARRARSVGDLRRVGARHRCKGLSDYSMHMFNA